MALLFYYTNILGLSGSLTGAAILIALACDAITDPIAGYISDNFHSRFGRRHPFMVVAAIPLAISFYFTFTPPEGLTELQLFLWLTFFAIATRASMTIYYVPHMALGAELSTDYIERTTIVSYRVFFGFFGLAQAVIITNLVFFAPWPEFPKGQMNPDAYPAFAHFGSTIMILVIWLCVIFTRKQIPYLPQAPEKPLPFSFMNVFREMYQALENRSFRYLFIGMIAIVLAHGLGISLMLHLGTYFWELDGKQITYIFAGAFSGNLCGVPVAKYLNQWIDKKPTLLVGIVFPPIFIATPIVLRLLGILPENGHAIVLPTIVLFGFLQMFCSAQAMVTGPSLIADMVDEHELKTGRRQEGIFFSTLSFIGKALNGLGVTVAGFGLDLIKFPVGAEPGTVAAEPLRNLGILYGVIPAVTALIAFLFYSRITINRETYARTLEMLQARRAGTINEDQ